MPDPTRSVLVTGATGLQGGATARALLARGWDVRALVRTTDSPPAQRLEQEGVTLVQGDLGDPASLTRAMDGVYGVFSVQNFVPVGPGGEIWQGRTVADAARAARVEHVVYSSVGGAERETGIPHFDSKRAIERYLERSGLRTTMLRPTFFMDNFLAHPPTVEDGATVIRLALKPHTRVQLIAVDDIGAFAADAFEQPGRYAGQAVELAGDELTATELAAAFGVAAGLPGRFEELPLQAVASHPYIPFASDIALMFDWFQRAGYQADISDLRTRRPDLLDVPQWLLRVGWKPATSG
jgi:uncharacterized protein YbjT (DUF2867 family)